MYTRNIFCGIYVFINSPTKHSVVDVYTVTKNIIASRYKSFNIYRIRYLQLIFKISENK